MSNLEIKSFVKAHGVRLWEIAVHLGISEATITRWLRVPLSEERQKMITDAVAELAAEQKGES